MPLPNILKKASNYILGGGREEKILPFNEGEVVFCEDIQHVLDFIHFVVLTVDTAVVCLHFDKDNYSSIPFAWNKLKD